MHVHKFICVLTALLFPVVITAQNPHFEVVKVAEGVYACVRTEPPGLTVNGNTVFIINDDDVVVVDTTLTPGSAKETIQALKKLTSKPVKYVINTHWHDDHIMGNVAYRQAFPGVEFIAHENTRTYLPATGLNTRKQAISDQGYPAFINALKSRLQKDESVFGGPMSAEERSTYASDIAIAEGYMAENPTTEVIVPTTTLEDRLTLRRGSRRIDILYLGRGHTSGDIVVFLPKEKIAISGDLVIWPVPYIGSPQSHPGDWSVTLRRLLALKPTAIVPGHGPVLRDHTYVTSMIRLLHSIDDQVKASFNRGESAQQAHKSVKLDDFETLFAGDSRMKRLIFRNYVAGAGVEAAYMDAAHK